MDANDPSPARTRRRDPVLPLTVAVTGLAVLCTVQLVAVRHRVEDDLETRAAAVLPAAATGVRITFEGRDGVLTVPADRAGGADDLLARVRAVDGVRVVSLAAPALAGGPATGPTTGPTTGPATGPTATAGPTTTPTALPTRTPGPTPAPTVTVTATVTVTSPPGTGRPGLSPEQAAVQRRLSALPEITFERGTADLTPEGHDAVVRAFRILADAPDVRVEIGGHTDTFGSARRGLNLSQARAKAVRALLEAHGLDPHRLRAVGYGETRPLVEERTEADRATNRRVELVVLP